MEDLLLTGVFLHLREQGLALTARDLEEALRALGHGFGQADRQRLQWLCETLWARSDDDLRKIRLLFRDLPKPSEEELRSAGVTLDVPPGKGTAGPAEAKGGTAGGQNVRSAKFGGPEQTGGGLPKAEAPKRGGQGYILAPSPPVSVRSQIIAWRRLRRPSRSGPKVHLDIDATIAEQCRQGILTEPVMVAQRGNQARVVVLMDASPSMAAWKSFDAVLRESLSESRLGQHGMYYFHNVPREAVYRDSSFTDPVALEKCLREHAGSALMIVSDAGAARGSRRRERIGETEAFVRSVAGSWRPVVWMNPMPEARWRGNTAARIGSLAGVSMFELKDAAMVKAVDVLRGMAS